MTKKEFIEYVDGFGKEAGEFTDDELYQIGVKHKELPLSEKNWDELVKLLGVDKKGEAFRTWIKAKQREEGTLPKNEKMMSDRIIDGMTFAEFQDETDRIKRELYKQQVKTRDTWNAYRRDMRSEAREEVLKDLITDAIKNIKPEKMFTIPNEIKENSNGEAVLLVSDWHIGVTVNNFYNKFNLEIAKHRITKLTQDAIRYCRLHQVKRLSILNLGDCIAGNIHITGRLEQQMDVVEQVITASELMANMLLELRKAAPEIIYYSCPGNHERITANLKESLDSENYSRIMDFYLRARLKNCGIEMREDNVNPEIGIIRLMNGKVGVFQHGHHGSFNTVFQDMVCYLGEKIDYGFVGHFHSEKLKTLHDFKLFTNASLVGMDDYAFQKRLFSKPAQSLLVFDKDNVINHSINLDIQD